MLIIHKKKNYQMLINTKSCLGNKGIGERSFGCRQEKETTPFQLFQSKFLSDMSSLLGQTKTRFHIMKNLIT